MTNILEGGAGDLEVYVNAAGVTEASFYSHREHPWHALGTVTKEAKKAEEALAIAKADYTVTKRPVYASLTDDTLPVLVPGKWATMRTNPYTGEHEALGVVGNRYTIVQNLEHAEFLNLLVDETGGVFETVGVMDGGRKVFVSIRMPDSYNIGGVDRVDLYLVGTNSHDGSGSFEVFATPIRPVCKNTVRMAKLEAVAKYRRRHTSGLTGAVQDAREALDLKAEFDAAFQAEAEALMAPMTANSFDRFANALLPEVEGDRAAKERLVKIEGMRYLFNEAPTQAAVRGTKWAAYQSVVEYVDWAWPVQGDDDKARALRTAIATKTDRIEATKDRALALLTK